MEPFFQLEDVTKTFKTDRGPYVAVDGVSLDIERGEIVSLIGHSGCGKSTVLSMMAGLQDATSGTLKLQGRPIKGPGPDRALVFQNYSLLPWMTVWDNIFEAVDSVMTDLSRAEKRDHVGHFLQMVGLWEHRFKRPSQISGGMKQRVAVARAFAVHPSVLLLDEPFGALDALTRVALQEELVKLWSLDDKTETVVLVTHDIEEAILLSDRIAVMTNGPSARIGEVVDVPLSRPRHEREIIAEPAYREVHDRLWYLLTEAYRAVA